MQKLKITSKRVWMETFMAIAIIGGSAQFFSAQEIESQLLAVECSTTNSTCMHTGDSNLGEPCCCAISSK